MTPTPTCPCGISRDVCDYHRPVEKAPTWDACKSAAPCKCGAYLLGIAQRAFYDWAMDEYHQRDKCETGMQRAARGTHRYIHGKRVSP